MLPTLPNFDALCNILNQFLYKLHNRRRRLKAQNCYFPSRGCMKVLNSETDSLEPTLKVTQPLQVRFERLCLSQCY